MTLDLTGKHCTLPHNFSAVFFFSFSRNNAAFLEPAQAANAHFADSIVWKNKSFLWKGRHQEKNAFLRTLFVENEIETSKLKWGGGMFFYEVESHMQNLSSFGQGKKIQPKKSLNTLFLQVPLQLLFTWSTLS